MDPVVAGSVVTGLVSIMSGVVKIICFRFSTRVELARIADAGLTARVRHTQPWGTLQEHGEGRSVRAASHSSGGGWDGRGVRY